MSISHLTNDLVLLPVPSQHQLQISTTHSHPAAVKAEESLRSLLLSLKPPLLHTQITDGVQSLEDYDSFVSGLRSGEIRATEEDGVKTAILGRLVVGLYAEAMDTFLKEAGEAENLAEWWGDVERSTFNVWHYFVQSTSLCSIEETARRFPVLHCLQSIKFRYYTLLLRYFS